MKTASEQLTYNPELTRSGTEWPSPSARRAPPPSCRSLRPSTQRLTRGSEKTIPQTGKGVCSFAPRKRGQLEFH
jgi:hypothetical protein